jgi:4-aminobutyrate aminotransferase/(S)-3-amino-2-methylpropionate transaminase
MSLPQQRRLMTTIPGPRSSEWQLRRSAAVPEPIATTHPIVTARAFGSIVEDLDGNRLIDLASGIGTLNVGHAAPAIVDAARRQLDRTTHTCFHVSAHEPYLALAERLNALMPSDDPHKTMLVNSGSEAVENAVKIARRTTGRAKVVAFDHAFHGRTLLGISLTDRTRPYKEGFGPLAPEIHRVPFAAPYRCPAGEPVDCADACLEGLRDTMRRIGEGTVAAVIVEPIQGEGGVVVPAEGFMRGVADLCARHDIVLIADEIQTGIGRTGRWFAMEHEGVVPDLVVTAKSLGGGLPIAAVTGRADLMDSVHRSGLGSTFGGNPVAAAAGVAVIETIEREELLERARWLGTLIRARLIEMAAATDEIGDVRGRGAMWGIELVEDRRTKRPLPAAEVAEVMRRCLAEGVIVIKAGADDNVIRLLPPLTIGEDLLDEALGVLEHAVANTLGRRASISPSRSSAP